jgi:protein SCO1
MMSDASPRVPRTIWIGFVLLFSFIGLAFVCWLLEATQLARRKPLGIIGPVADFVLTNQAAQLTTLAELTNHVWVADIVFTRCAGPCPRMTAQMKSLQEALPSASRARLVTLTTDPDFDTPVVLQKYAERFGADTNRWFFLTGTKREIAALASDSLKLSTQPIPPEARKDGADLFIHATIFVVVDKHARLRTYFETGGEGVDWTNVVQPKILRAVHQLEREL